MKRNVVVHVKKSGVLKRDNRNLNSMERMKIREWKIG